MEKIIHIDADCFFAAVEMRENPKLESVPIAVGGHPSKRGVIATCNYEARKFGVHSAMSSAVALKLCPFMQILPPRMTLYREYSASMREIFSDYTEKVEPLSLDEAYLDVTESLSQNGSATLIAKEIKVRVFEKLGIKVSAGVAPVKFLAKIASDWEKPDGLYVITPEKVDSFVLPLPVKKLPGVGAVTEAKLARNGIYTCADIREKGINSMLRLFGAHGQSLFNMSMGQDRRRVEARSDRKSVSVERTYENDMGDLPSLINCLDALIEALNERFARLRSNLKIRKIFVKVKFNDFSVTTVEKIITSKNERALEHFSKLLKSAWQRKKKPVRLIGVGYRLESTSEKQLPLPFEENEPE